MNVLTIDTSKSHLVSVILDKESESLLRESEQKFGSQALLKLIVEVLEEGKISFNELNEIKVATGPGSYTGLRVGSAVANALGYSLGIPVNGGEMEVELEYA